MAGAAECGVRAPPSIESEKAAAAPLGEFVKHEVDDGARGGGDKADLDVRFLEGGMSEEDEDAIGRSYAKNQERPCARCKRGD